MYRRRYWAVLGFELLIGFQILAASMALVLASTLRAAAVCVFSIGLGGWLFWKLVGVLARIQATEQRDLAPEIALRSSGPRDNARAARSSGPPDSARAARSGDPPDSACPARSGDPRDSAPAARSSGPPDSARAARSGGPPDSARAARPRRHRKSSRSRPEPPT
jgi:hypothetical protein